MSFSVQIQIYKISVFKYNYKYVFEPNPASDLIVVTAVNPSYAQMTTGLVVITDGVITIQMYSSIKCFDYNVIFVDLKLQSHIDCQTVLFRHAAESNVHSLLYCVLTYVIM